MEKFPALSWSLGCDDKGCERMGGAERKVEREVGMELIASFDM